MYKGTLTPGILNECILKPMFIFIMFGLQAQCWQGVSCGSCPHTVAWMCLYNRVHSKRSLSQIHRIARSVSGYVIDSALFDRVSEVEKIFADGWHSTACLSVDQCLPTLTLHYGRALFSPKRQRWNLRASRRKARAPDASSNVLSVLKHLL